MKLTQLRVICNIVDNHYNVSRAAVAANTSQPAMSKMVRALEQEVGAEIFIRSKGRLSGLTDLGVEVYALARRMLHDAASLTDITAEVFHQKTGLIRIATTHLHARYAIVPAIMKFAEFYPDVDVELTQQDPQTVMRFVASGECHLGLSTVPGKAAENVVIFPAYRVERCLITPRHHPLLRRKRKLTMADIAEYPLIAYDRVFASARDIMEKFARANLEPRVALKATDADVIKSAVAAGRGISIFQKLAVDPAKDKDIAVIDLRHLFPLTDIYISLRRGQYLRAFTYDLIACLAPQLSRREIEKKLALS